MVLSIRLDHVRGQFVNERVAFVFRQSFDGNDLARIETNPELIENAAIQQLWKNYENNQHKNRATFTKSIV